MNWFEAIIPGVIRGLTVFIGILYLFIPGIQAAVHFLKKGLRKIGFIDAPGNNIKYSELKWII